MGLFDDVGHADVLSAIEEYDRLGAGEFLHRYGFGRARDYVLWHDGRTYDSQAILGVARQYSNGVAATPQEFSGGRAGAAKLLADLGFYVTSADPYGGFGAPAGGSWREAAQLGDEAAGSAWASAARDVLLQAAHRYRAVVDEDDLATQVMYRTGVRTEDAADHWLTDVLTRVTADSDRRGEPLLAALCVDVHGRVGDRYAAAVTAATGAAPAPVEEHAAQQRLACYRHFHATGLPTDGGSVARSPRTSSPRAAAPRGRATKPATPRASRAATATVRPTLTCPTCFMALPATGICDTCD